MYRLLMAMKKKKNLRRAEGDDELKEVEARVRRMHRID